MREVAQKDIVLIVDDDEINRMILADILDEDYRIIEAEDGYKALEIVHARDTRPRAILLDIMMPGMDGFEVLEHLKSDADTARIPVLLITASDSDENESRGLKAGAADFLPKPFNRDIGKARLANHIDLARYQNELESLVEERTAELMRTYEQTLEVLATVVEYRSLESGEHIKRTSMLSEVLINHLMTDPKYADYVKKNDLNPKKAYSIVRATSLHDIGKIGISDTILLKPERLTDE
jgi:putative two-component system response regulator